MAKKRRSGWDRNQVEEWAFSVAALSWHPDQYWKVSRAEFLEVRKMWLKLKGVDVRTDAEKEEERIQKLDILLRSYGSKVETVKK